jgi:peptidoglycan/xylan/chitin deacetylase (PgdA/CDA1 family)
MIRFNLSVDFELGWGDLLRVARDEQFYRRVLGGLEQSNRVADLLAARGIPSTWGVVGACCLESLQGLGEAAPGVFASLAEPLRELSERRKSYTEVLFCRAHIAAIARAPLIEVGSHGFMHLLPMGLPTSLLRDDVIASVQTLRVTTGREIVSFIPPQNYHWPDEAFRRTGIRYVRHSPTVLGYSYSDPRIPAKLSRLWNDLIRPSRYARKVAERSRLVFLRVDRGGAVWKSQLLMLQGLLTRGAGSVFCFTHPHNLDTPLRVQRFAQFCDQVAELRERGRLSFRNFARELDTEAG